MADELTKLAPAAGSTQSRTRVGRGQGSGLGKTAGRGTKGQQARAGYSHRFGFEGGQVPLVRRLPKFGFTPPFPKEYSIVNVGALAGLPEGTVVDAELLRARGIVAVLRRDGVKVLGDGEIGVKLTVRAAKVSGSARAKIEAAGGSVEVVE